MIGLLFLSLHCCSFPPILNLLWGQRDGDATITATRRSCSTSGDLSSILSQVATGRISPSAAESHLAPLLVSGGAQAEDVGGFAKIDHDRRRRVGFPEVVFGEGKSAAQIVDILNAMIIQERPPACEATMAAADEKDAAAGGLKWRARSPSSPIVATRVSPEKWSAISAAGRDGLRYYADARIVSFVGPLSSAAASVGEDVTPMGTTAATAAPPPREAGAGAVGLRDTRSIGKVAVLSAGTSDLAVAEEAAVLAELAGAEVRDGGFSYCIYRRAIRYHNNALMMGGFRSVRDPGA